MKTPYKSVKHAIGEAAQLSRLLSYPRAADEAAVQREPDPERGRWPVAVRACLRVAGIDPDGDEAEALYTWATTSDGQDPAELEAIALELPDGSHEQRELLQQAATAKRLVELIDAARAALTAEELIARPKGPIKLIPVAWRVVEVEAPGLGVSVRHVHMVTDIRPDDGSLYYGPVGEARARAVARGEAEGPISQAERCPWVAGGQPKHIELRNELRPLWDAGHYTELLELDAEITERLDCTPQHARKVRASWGIAGSRGRAKTRPGSA